MHGRKPAPVSVFVRSVCVQNIGNFRVANSYRSAAIVSNRFIYINHVIMIHALSPLEQQKKKKKC